MTRVDPGTRPRDMSAAQHEATAAREEQAVAAHAALYDRAARVERGECTESIYATGPCWTTLENPTADHQAQARARAELAARHRAASQTLREAESRACAGLSDHDRDTGPFAHQADIARVSPLYHDELLAPDLVGAAIEFRAVPGMSVQWLQRIVDCHLARAAALGHDLAMIGDCPLAPKDVRAAVSATRKGFLVEIRSRDSASAREIWQRANRLAATDVARQ